MRSQAAQTCSQSRSQRPQHRRAQNTHVSRPILATPSPESTRTIAKGTNSRREPPSAPPPAPEPLTCGSLPLVDIKTGLFWYSAALPPAPGAPCTVKRSSQPSCPKRPCRPWARSKQPRRAPPAKGHCRPVPARCRPRPDCPRAPPAAAQASSPGLAGMPLGRFQTRWRRGPGAMRTRCSGRKAG